MTRDQFLKTPEDNLVTVRIVSPDGVERPFNRLLNTIPAADGSSFTALDEDAAGALEGMIVKLPEKVRCVIQKVDVKDDMATVHFVIDKPAGKAPVIVMGEEPKDHAVKAEPVRVGR